MIATLHLLGLTTKFPVWFFSTLIILNALDASHIGTMCHEHQINVNPFPSSPMKSSPLPSSSFGKNVATSNHESQEKKRNSNKKKQNQGGKTPTYGHYSGGTPPGYVSLIGGKLPASSHHVGGILPTVVIRVGVKLLASSHHDG